MQTEEMPRKTIQQRFILISFCLLLAIIAAGIATNATIHEVQTVHQQQIMVGQGDVRLIRQWMTIPYVAHVYRVPSNLIYTSLQLKEDAVTRHCTLQVVAFQRKQPVDVVIHRIQSSILSYHKKHPFKPYPTPTTDRGGQRNI
ncbi:hypothetical protein [Dictyobacter arantiisoli]|uniref:Uncharacterized protein n=1 Tax=Dictyobacter arantiisoli TaxID=2014874 RepID=A0A5A5T8I5_9CHLR|nr:hypothetical protein [Dictyobacter arantiisoli]GCF07476.1 hypothetical protein KDI_10400 [Dictyobacter arantiisoli]